MKTLIFPNDCRGPDGDCVCGPYTAPELWCLRYSAKIVHEAEAAGERRSAYMNELGRAAARNVRTEAARTREVRNKIGLPSKKKSNMQCEALVAWGPEG